MQKYFNNVQTKGGSAVAGARVTIRTAGGSLATIYSDNGVTVASNPLYTNTFGYFEFYAADGRYSIEIAGPGIGTQTISDVLLEDPADERAAIQAAQDAADHAQQAADGNAAALAASGGSSLVGFKQAGTGAVNRVVQDKLRDIVSVFDFMSTAQVADVRAGTASIDVTVPLQAAINACYGRRLFFPAGRYKITSELQVTARIHLDLAPNAIIDYSSVAAGITLFGQKILHIYGSAGSNVLMTADINIGDTSVKVASTAGLSAGDYVYIQSDQTFIDGFSNTAYKRGHIGRVATVDSGLQFSLVEKSPFYYQQSVNLRFQKLTMVDGVRVTGGQLLGGGLAKSHNAIVAEYTTNLLIEGVLVDGAESMGICAFTSVNATFNKNTVLNATNPGYSSNNTGTTGYGVSFAYGARDCVASNNSLYNCRHAVATNGGPTPVLSCSFLYNSAVNCGIVAAALDCHENSYWTRFIGNSVQGGNRGLVIRGQSAICEGNSFVGLQNEGVGIKDFSLGTQGINNVKVARNFIKACGNGILVEGSAASDYVGDLDLTENVIEDISFHGIRVFYGQRVNIVGNIIKNVTTVSGTSGNGIFVSSPAGSPTSADNSNIVISGNKIRNIAVNGIYCKYATSVRMANNDVRNCGSVTTFSSPIRCDNCDDVSIFDSLLVADRANDNHCIYLNDTPRVKVRGNTLLGLSTNANQDGVRALPSSGTINSIVVTENRVANVGRGGVNVSNYDRVIVALNDLRDAVSVAKVTITGATTSVNTNNIT